MTSVHRLIDTIARVRGMPQATVDSYTRPLRKGGVLPETRRGGAATPATPLDAAHILLAVMRGSPAAAVENAKEAGGLALTCDPITAEMERDTRAFLGWAEGLSLAEAIGWLIEQYRDGKASRYIAGEESSGAVVSITLDKYWADCSLKLKPSSELGSIFVGDFARFLSSKCEGTDAGERARSTLLDGEHLKNSLEFNFRSPLLFEASQAFGVDVPKHRDAHRRFREEKARINQFDIYGSETVTNRTLAALGEAFRGKEGLND